MTHKIFVNNGELPPSVKRCNKVIASLVEDSIYAMKQIKHLSDSDPNLQNDEGKSLPTVGVFSFIMTNLFVNLFMTMIDFDEHTSLKWLSECFDEVLQHHTESTQKLLQHLIKNKENA
jgi:hypothetical protein